MKVYRIENSDRLGPFHNCFSDSLPDETRIAWKVSSYQHKNLEMELDWFKYENFPDYVSGTSSLDILNDWFSPFYDQLNKAGYRIAIYEVSELFVIDSDTQLVFLRDESMFLGYMH